ncbi:Fe(3+)-hydroxamate ABC transporter permease FhuB [Phreatobacter stygius]|uniref:Fe(3+)-hydroxamate ABC transporter permease FhuB n=1 Tax=Phreatobacter stygius TaxID=1940610 RepID=A0A4D7B8Z1_9HYPH|nr:Fe(3+)-hydroxamate ABC transporter permease FhuB [Phreatobacter stygius]QCI64542.1 Fe(3+)-hydroxamate ABC transporter permease FhuB [Phreatobacter stygius]
MAEAVPSSRLIVLSLATGAVALGLGLVTLSRQSPAALWLQAFLSPDGQDISQLLVQFSWLPRLVTSLLAGAALALAGTLFQQILRNPLASPTTLGVAAGANLALAATTLAAPHLLDQGREAIALAGGLAAVALVFALSRRSGLSPVTTILNGLLVSLYAGAIGAMLFLLKDRYLVSLFIWGNGALEQQDWSAVSLLAPRLVLAMAAAILMIRPLTLLGLDDASARGLGLTLTMARLAGLVIAVAITASVVSTVGVIGFVGLAAPAIVGLAGARRFGQRLIWASVFGALLLCATDQMVIILGDELGTTIPTGAVTALFGAPLLIWLVPRVRLAPEPPRAEIGAGLRLARSGPLVLGLVALAVIGLAVSTGFGRGMDGWSLGLGRNADLMLAWRLPRAGAALAAGMMLAAAGVLIQRLTGNVMASPEMLGISAGAALGFVVGLFGLGLTGRGGQFAAAALGAGVALAVILALARRAQFSPERTLLTGVALGGLFDAVVAAAAAAGDPRAALLAVWLSGSTYGIDGATAGLALGSAIVLIAAAALTARWLAILPIGPVFAQSIGVGIKDSRFALLVFAALLTSAGSMIVGTLSFVGLMAPHLARRLGLERALPHLIGSAALGGLIMLSADWLGRVALFPRQLPAGLVATLIGVPLLFWFLSRRKAV